MHYSRRLRWLSSIRLNLEPIESRLLPGEVLTPLLWPSLGQAFAEPERQEIAAVVRSEEQTTDQPSGLRQLAAWMATPEVLAAAGQQLFAAETVFAAPGTTDDLDWLNSTPSHVGRQLALPEPLNASGGAASAEATLAGAPEAQPPSPTAGVPAARLDSEEAALLLLAGAGGIQSGPGSEGIQIRQVELRTNDLVHNPYDGYIYASVPSIAGYGLGNTISAVNPYSASVDGSVFIGSEPTKLAIADDGLYVYADLQGAAAIRRFNLTTWEAELQFPLSQPGTGFTWVEDMEVQPGNSSVVAVSRRNRCCSPRHEGVWVYADGVPLAQRAGGSNRIEFGVTGNRLYGYTNEISSFGFYRMEVSESGVRNLDETGGLISGFGVDIVHEAGRVYTSTGRVLDAEARALLGTYPNVGFGSLIRPDTANGVTYTLSGNTLTLFNQATFTPITTYTIPGIVGGTSSLIRWGDNGLAFRTETRVFLITFGGSGPIGLGGVLTPTPVSLTPPPPPASGPGPIRVRTITLPTNDLVFNPYDGYIYASVPSTAGAIGNSIAAINPWSAELSHTVFVGSEPTNVALSDDGRYVYTALYGAGAVRRFNTQTQEAELQFSLNPGGPVWQAEDMLVLAGSPESVAVSRRNVCCSPRHEGVAIYDNGVRRTVTTPNHTGSNRIEPSQYLGRLYGLNTETTEFGFRRMGVDEQGVRTLDTMGSPVYAFNVEIVHDNGHLYWNVGTILDPEERVLVGTYSGLGFGTLIRPDAYLGVTFALTDNVLRVFDQATFVPLTSYTIPGLAGGSGSLISWGYGEGALAFRNGNRVVIVDFVS